MIKTKLLDSVTIVLAITSIFCCSLLVSAETNTLPPTKRRVQTRKSGGTRGRCAAQSNSITLIVPENQNSRSDVPRTTLSHPTFVWYVAQKSTIPVKFTLVEPGKTIYTKKLDLGKSGLVALTLPKTVPPLEIGKEYRWTVSAICSSQHPSQNPYTQAWIERVSLSLIPEAEKNLVCDTYEKTEIWYDTLACYLESNSQTDIGRLFEQIDLGYLFNEQSVYTNNLN